MFRVEQRHTYRRRSTSALLLATILLFGCNEEDKSDPVLARAYDAELHWSDLRQLVPVSASAEDSAALAQRLVNNWIREQVLLHTAEQNLGEEQKDFESQLKEYRNDRLIYAYEGALVGEKLDTLVSKEQVTAYLDKNPSDFELKESVLLVRWSKVFDEDKKSLARLKRSFKSTDTEELRDYEVWLASRGIPIVDRSTDWITFQEMANALDMKSSELYDRLRKVGKVVLERGSTGYFIDVLGIKHQGETAPYKLVEQDIRSIVINQRKLQFIEQMREDLYRQALEQKDVEIL